MLDLDARRDERAEARRAAAGAQEGAGDTLPIRIGGKVIAVLQAELPLDAFSPLRTVSEDIALLLSHVVKIWEQQGTEGAQRAGMNLFMDLLTNNQNLAADILRVAEGITRGLLGDDGFEAFMRERPSPQDWMALARGLTDWYGVSLGESFRSTASSPSGGPTSPGTSPSTTQAPTETPAISGPPEDPPAT